VVFLQQIDELRVSVGAPIHERARPVLEHGDHVITAERLVRLQRVRHAQHLAPVAAQDFRHLPQQPAQVVLDPVRQPPCLPPGAPTSRRMAVEYDDTVAPIPQKPSMNEATVVADSRSPDTPEELSSSKNIRSPAREARDTRMSLSNSLRQFVNWSSGGILATMPR